MALRGLSYQERPQPPALPPRGGNQPLPMLQPKQIGADGKGDYLTENTDYIQGGPYDRGDASRRNRQTRSEGYPNNAIEVVRPGNTLEVPTEEHSKLAAKSELNPKAQNQANDVMENTSTDQNLDKTDLAEPSQAQKHLEGSGNDAKHSGNEDRNVKENALEATEFKRKESRSCELEESRERIIENLHPSEEYQRNTAS